MYQIVSPIYKIQDAQLNHFVMYVTPVLGLISLKRLIAVWPWDKTNTAWF
jgi:hypothetical protein